MVEPAPNSVIIMIGGRQVGVAVRQAQAFHFLATDPSFQLLDGSSFRRIDQVERSARHLWRALRQANGGLPPVEHRRVLVRSGGLPETRLEAG